MVITTVQGSVLYPSPEAKQQTISRLTGFVQWPLPYKDQYPTHLPTANSKPRPDHSVTYICQYRVQRSVPYQSRDAQQQTTSQPPCFVQRSIPYSDRYRTNLLTSTANIVPITQFCTMAITIRGSTPYLSPDTKQQTTHRPPFFRAKPTTVQETVPYQSPDGKQQTTSRPRGFAQWPLLSKGQYRTYLSMTNSKPRPNHPVGCNDHYRTRISTVSIFGGLITNQVPTTRLRTTVKSVQRPVPHLSHDAQQQTTSRSLCYLQRSIPYKDPYRIYLPTPNSDGRPDHSVGYNGHYRARISTCLLYTSPSPRD